MKSPRFSAGSVLLAMLCLAFPAPAQEGPEEILERAKVEALRRGVSDPEARLHAVAAEYAARRAEKARRGPLAVGGDTWISLGPTNGAGRIVAIAPHPTAIGTVYAGAADGGVWRTTDGGLTWTPLTDDLPNLSVGAVAVAPSAPDTIYLGTGESGLPSSFVPGIGLLKSTDAGATWQFPASVIATEFYRMSVHPTNPLELVAGTNGGGYRTTNAGATWTPVISHATYGEITEVVRHPTDPAILYAATWLVGASRVLKSTDSGATWVEKSTGLPGKGERLSLAIAPSNPLVLYSATEFDSGSGTVSHVYKTTDGGDSWADLPSVSANGNQAVSRFLLLTGFFANAIAVSPVNDGGVVAGGVRYIRSSNGSTFFPAPSSSSYIHVDAHEMRYQGTTLWAGHDGGVSTSTDGGITFTDRNTGLVTRQYYTLGLDPVNRNRMLAGSQDNGTDQRTDAGGTQWRMVLTHDAFGCGVIPEAPPIAYGSYQNGELLRTKDAGASDELLSFQRIGPVFPPGELAPFSTLLTIDPSRPGLLYTGTRRLWRSTNGGDFWAPLPTATTDGTSFNNHFLYTIAVAPSQPSTILIGKSPLVYRSTDGGATWVTASSGLPGIHVTSLEFDPTNAAIAYATIGTSSGQSVFRTTNGGASWHARSSGLPLFSAQVVRVDPTDPNVLYCGTDVGVYRSPDQGGSWTRFGTGLPAVAVRDIRFLEDGSALRVVTHGRGAWELQVPAAANAPPLAQITAPAAPLNASRGSALTFSGSVSDPDADSVSGKWFFPDTWESSTTAAGASTRQHRFDRAGVFPVSLGALDQHGARGADSVVVSVPEPFDACAAPRVIPGDGPFPYTVLTNSESATSQGTDPNPPICSPYGDTPLGSSLWFSFTPADSGTYEISICDAGFEHLVSVHTGPACGPYAPVACSAFAPQGSICTGEGATSLTLSATAGQTYRILVSDYAPYLAETFALTVRPSSAPASAPRLSNISQQTGATTGQARLALQGAGFVSGATVRFGGVAATDVALDGPTILFATTPAHAAGPVDVTVTNPDLSVATLSGGFRYTGGFGDANGNGVTDVADILYLINYLFAGGPAPFGSGDADGNGAVNVTDVLYLINFLFAGGPPPA